ncbi:SRPBCC family protein [Herbiconiux moechotypicola]|nr:SRPBCC family protein [Herbiconiux moechotypicola]MCS5728349.1 SRPBCC family protein [Herbiconiux moechotypicola]
MEHVWFTAAVETSVAAPTAFGRVVPRDDATLFRRHLGLPGVAGVRDATGEWDAPGRQRTVRLDDGGTFRETLLRYDPEGPERVGHFDYRVTHYTGKLAHLVDEGIARWEFRPLARGSLIRWSYGYRPLPRRRFVVERIVGPLWRSYMRAGLAECARVAEQE